MLSLKSNKCNLLKEAVASVANISNTKASIYYTENGLSLCVFKVPTGNLIALIHFLPSGFEYFDCGKPGHINIDLNAFSESINSATDKEVISISFGDIRKIKTYRGDKAIRFRFVDLETGQTRLDRMEFTKANKDPVDICEGQYNDLVVGIPSQEFNRVVTELDIAGETGTDDSLHISVSNEKLKFSSKGREIILVKELQQYELHGPEIEEPINQVWDVDISSSYLKAVNITDKVWLLKSNVWGTLLKCQIEHLGHVIFDLDSYAVNPKMIRLRLKC